MLDRIKEYYGCTRNIDFANHFHITQQNANTWYKRDRLDYDTIYKYCPEIDPDWLLSGGEGEMLRKPKQVIVGDGNTQVGRDLNQQPEDNAKLEKALDALRAEQESVKKAQEHAERLTVIIENLTARNDK
ncbi:MAG: helix-turn-helix domain-containing protein [Bacteroidales bacterium]|nr:helix-turn-helix domain-containing protein [Candidatus Egerieousia equi]